MAFETLPTIAAPAKDAMASISYRLPFSKHGRSKTPRLIIGIPGPIAGNFKPKASQLFALQIGDGSDQGKARIVEAGEGVSPRMLRGGAAFRFGYVPVLGQNAAEKEYVAAKAIKGGFELTLPKWFVAALPRSVK
jgi:hypothetical protein